MERAASRALRRKMGRESAVGCTSNREREFFKVLYYTKNKQNLELPSLLRDIPQPSKPPRTYAPYSNTRGIKSKRAPRPKHKHDLQTPSSITIPKLHAKALMLGDHQSTVSLGPIRYRGIAATVRVATDFSRARWLYWLECAGRDGYNGEAYEASFIAGYVHMSVLLVQRPRSCIRGCYPGPR